jgi:oxalate decarboxylase/phosphoglucose isomerase-like protein (cupin superfamily)
MANGDKRHYHQYGQSQEIYHSVEGKRFVTVIGNPVISLEKSWQ